MALCAILAIAMTNTPNEPNSPNPAATASDTQPELRRVLTLPLVVLYGMGTTVGAGIYVLVGATAGRAGIYAPAAFLIAALVMTPTALSFAEFVGRQPVSAGEAAYVRKGFGSRLVSLIVGLLVVSAGVVSAAAVSIGSIGYLQQFLSAPQAILIPIVILILGAIAAWGILESVAMAALLTVIEIAGLMFVIGAGIVSDPTVVTKFPTTIPLTLEAATWAGIASGALLAFYAFIGFEDMVNVAEETQNPARILPQAIFITLAATTVLYVLVSAIAVLSVPIETLAAAPAPLSLLFRELTGASPTLISAIAIVAALNGGVIQIIMASRVLYGLSRQGSLPAALGVVNPVTATPVRATLIVVAAVLILAMLFTLEGLAEATSRITLIIFALVNVALINVKRRREPAPAGTFVVPVWIPVLGVLSCLALIISGTL
jgi:basic amino acid/polyamine antiporter, APA family